MLLDLSVRLMACYSFDSNLPSFLGGDCTCSESGGCLFSDKGPWNDPDITQLLQVVLFHQVFTTINY